MVVSSGSITKVTKGLSTLHIEFQLIQIEFELLASEIHLGINSNYPRPTWAGSLIRLQLEKKCVY